MIWLTGLTAVAVVALIAAERLESPMRRGAKVVASTGFVGVAIVSGAFDSGYGRAMLVGFVLAWIGDLLLTFPSRRAFVGGLVAFLLGHVAYVIAFGVRGLAWLPVAATGGGVVVTAWFVWRWLRPHLDRAMVRPVGAYVLVISAMVVAALSTAGFDLDGRIVAGAIAFYLSDLFVARQRFVTPGFVNRAWGLPLYYGGQVLLALSVGG